MRFWDTSAVVPLIVTEARSEAVRDRLRRDGDMAVWWATPVECWSALEEVRLQARRLLRVHRLRAADALQLAAAIVWSGSSLESEFVTANARLGAAARLEGLLVDAV